MADDRKLLAEWFWTDRWMGSRGFLLPMEPRGLYREMLTQAWRRGARLPNDYEEIRRAVGCTPAEWRRCWPKIQQHWRVDGDSLVNDTQLEVYAEALGVQQRAHERGVRGAQARAQARAQAQHKHALKDQPPSPSPTEEKIKITGAPRRPVENRTPDEGTFGLYCRIADEARKVSNARDRDDSIANVAAIFKDLCAEASIDYDSEKASRAIEAVMRQVRAS